MASVVSSEDDYHSCIDEMDAGEVSPDESLFDKADQNEPGISPENEANEEAESDDQPSTVPIYSVVAPSPLLFSSSPPPLTVILTETADQAVQSGEHDFERRTGTATIVVWDPLLPNSFPPTCRTSILPPWWRSEKCVGTFGFPAYQQLIGEVAAAARFDKGDPQSDDMEGGDVWDSSVTETLRQRMRRLNYICRRRIAVLTGEADRDFAAAATASTAAIALAEAIEVVEFEPTEFFPDNSQEDIAWQNDSNWTEGYQTPTTYARPLVEQPLPRFITGHGFARHLVHPIPHAHAPVYPSPYAPFSRRPFRQTSVRPVRAFECPKHVSPLEAVMSKDEGVLLKFYPDIIAEALIEEFGMPPYPQYIVQHLPSDFLISPTNSEPVLAVQPLSLPASEPEGSVIEIEWDIPTEPIGFHRFAHSTSEQPEARTVSPTTVIVPTASVQQLAINRPAPTERLTEQNPIVPIPRIPIKSPPSMVCLRLRPNCPPERVEDAPISSVVTDVASRTTLIVDNHSPLYNANGYRISQVSATVARLQFTMTPEYRFRFHRGACLTHRSETEGIPIRLPLNAIFEHADLLMLWTCHEVHFNCP